MNDTAQFTADLAARSKAEADSLAAIIAAATAAGKEPFTLEAFEAEQIKQNKTIERVLSPATWSEKYYRNYPDLMTVSEFVQVMYEVDPYV
jgi:hypothetical protein